MPSNDAFAKAVEKAFQQQKAYLAAHLSAPNKMYTLAMNEETQQEEKPMHTLIDIGKAKKQRDVLRIRIRTDIQKYVTKFGVTQFEAAHAILDSLLNNINETAKTYDQCAMPNALAQTLLPDTTALIGGSGTIATPGGSTPIWHAGPLFKPKKTTKAPKSTHGLAKLDKDVTDADLDYTYLVHYNQNYSKHCEILKEYQAADGNNFFLSGSTYVYSSAKSDKFGGAVGNVKVIWTMSKAAPYIKANEVHIYNLHAPVGYKFRKLKNKPILKLIKDPKQKGYWTKIEAAEKLAAQCDTVSGETHPGVVALIGGKTYVAMTHKGGMSQSYIQVGYAYHSGKAVEFPNVPEGYKWVVASLINDTKKLVKVEAKPTVPETVGETVKAYDVGGTYVHITPEKPTSAWIVMDYPLLTDGYAWFPADDTCATFTAKKLQPYVLLSQETAKTVQPVVAGIPEVKFHWETYISNPDKAILMPDSVTHTHTGPDGQKYSSAKAEFPYNPVAWGGDLD